MSKIIKQISKEKDNSFKCNYCKTKKAIFYCKTCKNCLCKDCENNHKNSNKDHNINKIEEKKLFPLIEPKQLKFNKINKYNYNISEPSIVDNHTTLPTENNIINGDNIKITESYNKKLNEIKEKKKKYDEEKKQLKNSDDDYKEKYEMLSKKYEKLKLEYTKLKNWYNNEIKKKNEFKKKLMNKQKKLKK